MTNETNDTSSTEASAAHSGAINRAGTGKTTRLAQFFADRDEDAASPDWIDPKGETADRGDS
jgi:hypothetical protein